MYTKATSMEPFSKTPIQSMKLEAPLIMQCNILKGYSSLKFQVKASNN